MDASSTAVSRQPLTTEEIASGLRRIQSWAAGGLLLVIGLRLTWWVIGETATPWIASIVTHVLAFVDKKKAALPGARHLRVPGSLLLPIRGE